MGAQPDPRIRSVPTALRGHWMTRDEVENFSASFFSGAVSWRTRKSGSFYQRTNIASM